MSGSLGASGTTSGSSSTAGLASLNSTYFNQLIDLQLQRVKAPIQGLQSDRTALSVSRGMFVDMKVSFGSLNSIVSELKSSSSSLYEAKSVDSSDAEVVTASGDSSAATGSYTLQVTTLAKSHRVQGDAQPTTDQPLGLSGTPVLGGAATRSVADATTVAETVTGFAISGAPRSGLLELGSGTYSVEVQNIAGSYRFRLVDAEGQAVSIAKAGDASASATAAWQDLTLVAGTAFDTGRGLSISFGAGPYVVGSRGAGAASVTYTAQGAQLVIASTDSLTAIRDMINAATHAEGNGVRASIVDRRLVLEGTSTGQRRAITAIDGGYVLAGLGLLSGGAFKSLLQSPVDATFTVGGIAVQRSRNSGLTDILEGVTLGLVKEGESATVSVKPDSTLLATKIGEMLQKLNSVTDYLREKVQVTKDETTNTYTRGGLAGDSLFLGLRQGLISALRGKMAGASSTDLDELADLGIGLDSSLHYSVTNSAKLEAALADHATGVKALLDDRMAALSAKLAPYITSGTGLLDARITALDSRSTQIGSRISQVQARAKTLEEHLVQQYGKILMQLPTFNQNQAISNVLYTTSVTA
jgi:flagellar capping protein FliD